MYRSFTSASGISGVQQTQTVLLPPFDPDELTSETPTSNRQTPAATTTLTLPASPTISPAPILEGGRALVLLVKDGDKSIFVVNQGPADLPLEQLKLGNPPSQVSGEQWKINALKPGECVSVWFNIKASNNDQAPRSHECSLVGEKIERKGNARFWTNEFYIYYAGEFVGKCAPNQKDCEIQIELNQ